MVLKILWGMTVLGSYFIKVIKNIDIESILVWHPTLPVTLK